MTDFEPEDLISSADISRLTGASPQAISNWRARNTDFPEPVAGTEKRPLFVYGQVLEWLQRNGKLENVAAPQQNEIERLIRAIAAKSTPIELFASSAFSLALLVIRREIEAGNFLAIEGLTGNESVLKGAARDGISEIANGASDLTVFEQLLMNSDGQFGRHFRNFATSNAWLATRADLVRYFSTSRNHTESYLQFAVAFEARFPKDGFQSSTPVELTDELSLTMAKTAESIVSVIDICAGVGNALFALAKTHRSDLNLVAIELDPMLCGVMAARAVIEGVNIQIFSGDVIETIHTNRNLTSGFDVVLCDPPMISSFSATQLEMLPRMGIRVDGGEATELVWAEIARSLISAHGKAFVLLSESALGGQAVADVNARVHLLQTQQVKGVLELPSGLFHGTSPNRTWYLLVLQGALVPGQEAVQFVSHDDNLTGPPVTLRESLSFGLDKVLQPLMPIHEPFCNNVPIAEIIKERGQMLQRFFGSGDVGEELAEDIRPASAWSDLVRLLAEKGDLLDLVFSNDGEPVSIRVDDAVKNKMLKVYSGRSLAAKVGEPISGVLHIGRSAISRGVAREERVYSAVSNSKFLLEVGDVLLITSEHKIETMVWVGSEKAAPGAGVSVLRITSPSIDATHLAWALRGRGNVALLSDDGRMKYGVLDRFEFSLPPIGQQTLFAEKLRSLEQVEAALHVALLELDRVRQAVSTNLAMSGMTFSHSPELPVDLNILGLSNPE